MVTEKMSLIRGETTTIRAFVVDLADYFINFNFWDNSNNCTPTGYVQNDFLSSQHLIRSCQACRSTKG